MDAEDHELHQRAASQLHTVPKTLKELEGHPVFVRGDKLKKYEAIRPKAKAQGVVQYVGWGWRVLGGGVGGWGGRLTCLCAWGGHGYVCVWYTCIFVCTTRFLYCM